MAIVSPGSGRDEWFQYRVTGVLYLISFRFCFVITEMAVDTADISLSKYVLGSSIYNFIIGSQFVPDNNIPFHPFNHTDP